MHGGPGARIAVLNWPFSSSSRFDPGVDGQRCGSSCNLKPGSDSIFCGGARGGSTPPSPGGRHMQARLSRRRPGSSTSTTTTTRLADAFTRHQDRRCGTVGCVGPTSTAGGACSSAGRSTPIWPTRHSIPCPSPAPSTTGIEAIRGISRSRRPSGSSEPLRPEYQDRDLRLKVMDQQGVAGTCSSPPSVSAIEDALQARPGGCGQVFPASIGGSTRTGGIATRGGSSPPPTSR